MRVRAGSKRSGAGTDPDVRPAKRRAGSRKGVKATRCKVSAANGAGGVDGGHSGMGAEEEGGLVGGDLMGAGANDPAAAEAPGQSPSATDSSMNGADVRNHVQEPATRVSGAADTAEAGLITMTMQAPSSSGNPMMGAGAAEAEESGAAEAEAASVAAGQPAPSALLSQPSHDTLVPAAAAPASTQAPASATQDTPMAAAEHPAEAEASVASASAPNIKNDNLQNIWSMDFTVQFHKIVKETRRRDPWNLSSIEFPKGNGRVPKLHCQQQKR